MVIQNLASAKVKRLLTTTSWLTSNRFLVNSGYHVEKYIAVINGMVRSTVRVVLPRFLLYLRSPSRLMSSSLEVANLDLTYHVLQNLDLLTRIGVRRLFH